MEAQSPPESAASAAPVREPSGWLSSAAVAALVLLAGAGAAAHPEGLLIGIPGAGTVGVALLLGGIVRASGIARLEGFLLPALAALLAALILPSFRSLWLFSGPPLFALALAAVVLALGKGRVRPNPAILFPVVFAVYAGVAFEVQSKVGPEGDEPQYLMVAQSLIQDQDLVLDRDFQERRYSEFFDRPLKPDFRIRGPEGQIYSLHAVGLSILILPAYFVGGYAGASFFMAFLAALLVRELRRLVRDLSGEEALAEGTAWLLAFSPPIIHFAGLIFTEIPAALLLCVGLRTAAFAPWPRAAALSAACAAALPWLNVRYSILALAITAAILLRWRAESIQVSKPGSWRSLVRPAITLALSAVALSLFHFKLWGFFDPRRVYGRRREFSLDVLPEGLPGLFLDQEFGLFAYAPIFVLAFFGFPALWRRSRGMALGGLLAAAGVIATASVWPMWRGGFNPPARFLVPLIPVLGAGLALFLSRGIRPATALLAGWGLWCGLGGALNVETIHRDRDGVAPYFRTQSGAREWTQVLPSFVLPEDRDTRLLAWPWLALLGLPLLAAAARQNQSEARTSHRDVLAAVGALMVTAVAADQLSPRVPRPEHGATRLLGAPSVLLPTFHWQSSTPAVWPIDLFYEPHRAPGGLTFATAVTLQPDRYTIRVSAPDPSLRGATPALEVRERHSARNRQWPMEFRGGSLLATFQIEDPGDYDLSLRSGGPVWLQEVRIETQ